MQQIPLKSSSSPSARSCGHLAGGEGTAIYGALLAYGGGIASHIYMCCRLGLLNKPIYGRIRITEALITLLSDLLQFNGSRDRSKVTRTMTIAFAQDPNSLSPRAQASQIFLMLREFITTMRNMCVCIRWDETFFSCHTLLLVAGTFIYIPNCGTRSGNINVLCIKSEVSEAFILPRSRTHWTLFGIEREQTWKNAMRAYVTPRASQTGIMYTWNLKKSIEVMRIVYKQLVIHFTT